MKVLLVPSTVSGDRGDDASLQYATSYLINDTIAIDAGTLGFYLDPHSQAKVRHLFLTHTHIDHIASLPILVENAFEFTPDCVTIYGSQSVLDCLKQDVFNDRVWPDFLALSAGPMKATPFLKLQLFEPGDTIEVDGVTIHAVAVDHIVPTQGHLIEQDGVTIVIPSDTGPTEEIWRQANRVAEIGAVFLEVCFPDNMAMLASVSKHLTPATFAREVQKVRRAVPFYTVHIKARYREQVLDELGALGLAQVEPARFGHVYEFLPAAAARV